MNGRRTECTCKDLGVVVTESQGSDGHDLRYGAKSEVLRMPHSLHVLQALWSMSAKPYVTVLRHVCAGSRTFCIHSPVVHVVLEPLTNIRCAVLLQACFSAQLIDTLSVHGSEVGSMYSPPTLP